MRHLNSLSLSARSARSALAATLVPFAELISIQCLRAAPTSGAAQLIRPIALKSRPASERPVKRQLAREQPARLCARRAAVCSQRRAAPPARSRKMSCGRRVVRYALPTGRPADNRPALGRVHRDRTIKDLPPSLASRAASRILQISAPRSRVCAREQPDRRRAKCHSSAPSESAPCVSESATSRLGRSRARAKAARVELGSNWMQICKL